MDSSPSDILSFLDSPFENSSHSQFGEDFQILDQSLVPLKSSNDPCVKKFFLDTPRKGNRKCTLCNKTYRISTSSNGEEIEEYLTDPVAQTSVDIIDWWSRNANRFPKLSTMAKDYLCEQTTSVASEQPTCDK
ncbi:unnamed protein product [Gordionus sp. m RMFG-2023]